MHINVPHGNNVPDTLAIADSVTPRAPSKAYYDRVVIDVPGYAENEGVNYLVMIKQADFAAIRQAMDSVDNGIVTD